MRLDGIDLLDVDVFLQGREYDLFRRLRDEAPVYFHPESDGPGFHAVTRFDDVVDVVRRPLVFCSSGGTQIKNRKAEGHGTASVHNSDPPYHTQLRNAVLPSFRAGLMQDLATKIRTTVHRLIDQCPRGEAFDFVSAFAVKLPMMVIGDLMGVPASDQPRMVAWANAISDVLATEAQQAQARHDLFRFFRELVELKRREPGDDLATVLTQADIDGRPLTASELDAFFIVLSAAGNETTRFLLSGGLEQLCLQPEDLERLRRAPDQIPAAVEEMLRYISPVMQMRRTATEDSEIAGKAIRKGEKVVVYFASANRDERKFSEPELFKPGRDEGMHVGFGNGIHFCIGAHLARLETQIFFESLFERVGGVHLAGRGERLPSYLFHGHVRLPVVWN
jgi:cytochrome P450